jgi:redox-sensitive bicupin YhaK (pirin superfamily)
LPNELNVVPSYEQKTIDPQLKRGKLLPIASNAPSEHAVKIHADATLHAGLFDADEELLVDVSPVRLYYVHLVKGSMAVNGQALSGGDAALISQESKIHLSSARDAEVLFFDLVNQ